MKERDKPFQVRLSGSEHMRFLAAIERESKPSAQAALREATMLWVEASEGRLREREEDDERSRTERRETRTARKTTSERRQAALASLRGDGGEAAAAAAEVTTPRAAAATPRVVVSVPAASDGLVEGLVRHVLGGNPLSRERLRQEAVAIIQSSTAAEQLEARVRLLDEKLRQGGASVGGGFSMGKNPLDFLDRYILGGGNK